MKQCLYCLKALDNEQSDFHSGCSLAFFGRAKAPVLPYGLEELHELARQTVSRSIAVPGVQPKLSLAFEQDIQQGGRLTLVGLWGEYILKPPNANFPELVENEHATMLMAQAFEIGTVPFSLVRLQSGERAYITRRIDRVPEGKLAMEDFCQLTERLTEHKYRGALEKVAKTLNQYASNPGADGIRLLEIVLFSWLTGNSDMHLKNYSMLTHADGRVSLAPAYDLLSTALATPDDDEESALTINAKKNKLNNADFEALIKSARLPLKSFENLKKRFFEKLPLALAVLDNSFLSKDKKKQYKELIDSRVQRLV